MLFSWVKSQRFPEMCITRVIFFWIIFFSQYNLDTVWYIDSDSCFECNWKTINWTGLKGCNWTSLTYVNTYLSSSTNKIWHVFSRKKSIDGIKVWRTDTLVLLLILGKTFILSPLTLITTASFCMKNISKIEQQSRIHFPLLLGNNCCKQIT